MRAVGVGVGRSASRLVSLSEVKSLNRIDDINQKQRIKIFDMIRVRIVYNRIEERRAGINVRSRRVERRREKRR